MKVGKIYGDLRLASYADVQHNWAFYSKQVPPDYKPRYRYEGVRYTNWSKILVLSPLAKLLLNACLGVSRADQICIRTHFLKVYNSWSYLLLLLYTPVGLITLKKSLPGKKLKRRVSLPHTPNEIEVHPYDMREQDRAGRKVNEAS